MDYHKKLRLGAGGGDSAVALVRTQDIAPPIIHGCSVHSIMSETTREREARAIAYGALDLAGVYCQALALSLFLVVIAKVRSFRAARSSIRIKRWFHNPRYMFALKLYYALSYY